MKGSLLQRRHARGSTAAQADDAFTHAAKQANSRGVGSRPIASNIIVRTFSWSRAAAGGRCIHMCAHPHRRARLDTHVKICSGFANPTVYQRACLDTPPALICVSKTRIDIQWGWRMYISALARQCIAHDASVLFISPCTYRRYINARIRMRRNGRTSMHGPSPAPPAPPFRIFHHPRDDFITHGTMHDTPTPANPTVHQCARTSVHCP